MTYSGDIALDQILNIKFTTVNASGVPTTLAGTPVVSAYVSNNTTQITAGITLTVDFDGVTGLHNVRVDPSTANGYAVTSTYTLVITTGTVGGVSVVGYVVGSFSVVNRTLPMLAALATAHGSGSWDSTVPASNSGTATAVATNTITLAASAVATAGYYVGQLVSIIGGTLGIGQSARIINYTTGRVATVDRDWPVTPTGTILYVILPDANDANSAYIDGFISGRASQSSVDSMAADMAGILEDTDELQLGWTDDGRLDVILDARASQTSVDDLPTNAELATSQAAADDATLAAVSAVDTVVNAILMDTGTTLDAKLTIVVKHLLNRLVVEGDGTITLYDDDDVTPLYTWAATDDATDLEIGAAT